MSATKFQQMVTAGHFLFMICLSLSLSLSLFTGQAHAQPDCGEAGGVSIHCAEAPSAWFDDDGTLWTIFGLDGHAYVATSTDKGDSFSSPVRVNAEPETIEVNGENRPKILVDRDGVVYVSWTQQTEGMFTGDIRFSRSVDGGRTFAAPRTINDDGLLTSHRFESMLLTPSGLLYITWLDKRELEYAAERGEEYRGSAVFYAVSDDQGASFSDNYKVADHSCECCRIAVAPHGDDQAALMWRHIFGESTRDHAIAIIDADGETQYQERASRDDWQIQACPHHGPDMAAGHEEAGNSASYHMTWFSNGSQRQGIHYGLHDPATGDTTQLHEVDGGAGASHPQIEAHDGVLYLVWKHFNGEETQLRLIRSADNGQSWSAGVTLTTTAGGSDHPLLVPGPDAMYVSWMTRAEGYRFLPIEQKSFELRPFHAHTLDAIKEEYAGEPFILALWSVTCPPCMVELEMLGELRREVPDLPLVLVSTDHIRQAERAEDFLLRYDLHDMASWMFADDYRERLRFSIDPQWFGELPRSYYFDAGHQPHAHSGVLTEQQVRDWLDLPQGHNSD